MNYQKHYDRLIARARNRVLDGYVEVHHVIPRCMGGSDDMENLVQLTAEEHFVAHQLLHKIHPKVNGLMFALISMVGNPHGKRRNKAYGWMRRKHSLNVSEQMQSLWKDESYVKRQKAGMDKLRQSLEYVEKLKVAVSKANKGRVKSAEEIAKFVASKKGMKYRKMSPEARANMSAARRKVWEQRRANGTDKLIAEKTRETRIKNGSYKFSDEHKAAISRAQTGKTIPLGQRKKISESMKLYRSLH